MLTKQEEKDEEKGTRMRDERAWEEDGSLKMKVEDDKGGLGRRRGAVWCANRVTATLIRRQS